jgi:hypothetical protein
MTWRQVVRQMEANARRHQKAREREAVRQHRELQKYRREHAKQSEKAAALYEVKEFENYVDLLVSLHKDRSEVWPWATIANAAAPPAPVRSNRNEAPAAHALQSYAPGFFEKLFGGAKRRIAELEVDVARAQQADQVEFAQASEAYKAAHSLWEYRRYLAGKLLARDPTAFSDALTHTGAFDEIGAFQTQVVLSETEPSAVVLTCQAEATSPVPDEELKLTASGKVSTKAMPTARYWALHQDFVCSSALRVAGEALAVLPLDRAVVNVGSVQTNTSTGHPEFFTFLAVHFVRNRLLELNLAQVDASDCMRNFPHRMKFKKSSGFEPVEPMTLQENWVST